MKKLIKMQANPSVSYAVDYETDEVMTVSNYQGSNVILHIGYVSKKNISEMDDVDVGIWQPKCVHVWKTNIAMQYQQCTKCGKGHSL